MGARFLTAFFAMLVVTVCVLAGAGYAITRVAVSPPREVFRGAAFDFELAPGWWCEYDDGTYACTPPGKPPHSAIAVIAMKERNTNDNLKAYEEHLRKPKSITNSEGERRSEVRYVKRRQIGPDVWVEALHSGSELRNYDTYYLGTTTSNIGVLVTLSVHKDHVDKYIAQMNDMIKTLKVYQR